MFALCVSLAALACMCKITSHRLVGDTVRIQADYRGEIRSLRHTDPVFYSWKTGGYMREQAVLSHTKRWTVSGCRNGKGLPKWNATIGVIIMWWKQKWSRQTENVEKYLFQTHTLTHTQKHQKHLRVSPWLPWPLVVISRLEMGYARNTMYSKHVSESKATPPRSAFLLHSWFSSDWRNWISDVECPHPPHYNTRRLVNRNHHLNIPKVSRS